MPLVTPPERHRRIKVVPPPAAGSPTVLRTLAVVAACVVVLFVAREVCVPIVLAILLAFVLSPIITLFRHWRLPRVPSILVTVALALGMIVAFGGAVGFEAAQLIGRLPQIEASLHEKADRLEQGALGRFAASIKTAEEALRAIGGPSPVPPSTDAATPKPTNPLLVRLAEQEASSLSIAAGLYDYLASPLSTTGIVLIVVIFMLLQREDLRDRMIRLFGSHDLNKTTHAMNDAAHRLSLYFLAQVAVNFCFGTIIWLGLTFIGVPSALLWGILAMLLRFVPYVGVAIAAVLPIVLAAATEPQWTMAIETAGFFAIAEGVTGQAVEPLLYGRSTGLSPFAVIASALFWSWLWGPIGLILSTPFTVALVVLGRHVPQLLFLDVLLGDEPALTPIQSFYQRILAGDVDEARDHAEDQIAHGSLPAYYDEVAVKALQLAAGDHASGALGEDAMATMRRSLRELVDDLGIERRPPRPVLAPIAAQDPAATNPLGSKPLAAIDPAALPPHWRGPGAVLCVAGRGPLDEEAAAILVQLLGKHNLSARLAPHADVARQVIANLDVERVAMVCLVHVEIAGDTPYLRYLVERVRHRLPGRRIAVGLWSVEAVAPTPDLCERIGADHVAISLREMLDACLEAAGAPSQAIAAA